MYNMCHYYRNGLSLPHFHLKPVVIINFQFVLRTGGDGIIIVKVGLIITVSLCYQPAVMGVKNQL